MPEVIKENTQPIKPPEKSEREKEIEAQILKLQKERDDEREKRKKQANILKRIGDLFVSKNTEPEPPKEPETTKSEDQKRLEAMEERVQQLELEKFCHKHGIPEKHQEYFLYLCEKAQVAKGEDQLDPEEIQKIVKNVESLFKKEKEDNPPQPQKTSGTTKSGQKSGLRIPREPQPVLSQEEIELKAFRNMGSGKRIILAKENPELYKRLSTQEWKEDGWNLIDKDQSIMI